MKKFKGQNIFILLVLLGFDAAYADPLPYLTKATVEFEPVEVSPKPGQLDADVTLVGAYEMKAHGTSLFVGLSDVGVTRTQEGYHGVALSDFGRIFEFDLNFTAQSIMPSKLTFTDLRDEKGNVFDLRSLSDSEDFAIDGQGGDVYISFERRTRILRYPKAAFAKPSRDIFISGLPELPLNEGIEALTALDSETLLLGVESGGFYACKILASRSCQAVPSDYAPGLLYKIVSLEALPPSRRGEGNVLALWRYFDPITGPRNRLTLMQWDGKSLHHLKLLVKIAPPLPADNYEGVAAVPSEDGYRLFLIADSLDENRLAHLLIFDWRTK